MHVFTVGLRIPTADECSEIKLWLHLSSSSCLELHASLHCSISTELCWRPSSVFTLSAQFERLDFLLLAFFLSFCSKCISMQKSCNKLVAGRSWYVGRLVEFLFLTSHRNFTWSNHTSLTRTLHYRNVCQSFSTTACYRFLTIVMAHRNLQLTKK